MKRFLRPWLGMLLILVLCWWARSVLMEGQQVAFFCQDGGKALVCTLRSGIERVFYSNPLCYLILALGTAAILTRRALIAELTIYLGIAALMLHNSGEHQAAEFTATGFLLSVLTLLRLQFSQYRRQHGPGDCQT